MFQEAALTDRQKHLRDSVEQNFLDIWIVFLQQNVARHKLMSELAGNPTKAFLAEAIYWHELLLLNEKGTSGDYTIVRATINEEANQQFDDFLLNKKLTSSLLSELTGIPFETARRNLKSMVSDQLLEEHEQFGFLINKQSAFHKACVERLNPFEQQNLVKLVSKILDGTDITLLS